MKKTILIFTLLILILPVLCLAGPLQDKQRAVIVKKNAVANGVVGATGGDYGDQQLLDAANTESHFDIASVVTAGVIGYCHLYQGASASSGKTITISMQEASDGGTVRLYKETTSTGASAWLNVQMNTTYTVSLGQTYWLTVQISSSGLYYGRNGAFSSDSIRHDSSWSYSSGASMSDEGEELARHMMIICDNQSGDPS